LDGPLGGLVQKTRLSANAAASLVTNAPDYARFAAAVMSGEGLSPGARAAMLEPRVALTSRSLFSAPGTDRGANRAHKMAWTPGWGTFEDQHGPALFHVGMEEVTTSLESFSAPLVDYALGPAFSPLAWLEYGAPPPANRTPAGALAAAAGLAAGVLGLALLARRWRGRGGAR
ncbi:MAG: class beta-lactamase-related serine hydrolase, partial [Acidobacteria bacterium]|nr:class beta-lactamase-related serine hydrolase [Acidobacteriota bacterium]